MEYTTKEELVEMYKKGKEAVKLKTWRVIDSLLGSACAGATMVFGIKTLSYSFSRKPDIATALFGGAFGIACGLLSYDNLRRAYEENKKVKGLEKEVAELEKE